MKQILADVLYPTEGEKRGIVITQSMRSMFSRGKFGYISIGKDQDDAKEIEGLLEQKIAQV